MRSKLNYGFIAIGLLLLFTALPDTHVFAQCSMCRAGVASNLKDHSNNVGAGLNNGILYLMSVPYIIGGIAAIVWFKKKKQIKAFLDSTN